MKELVVLSGKGGTGKTSIVASFAALAQSKVIADCDVDAADLHLVLSPTVKETSEFWAGKTAAVDRERCTQCRLCQELCRFKAIHDFTVDPLSCEGCGLCYQVCPAEAIRMEDNLAGHWFISETRYGPLVHARLGIAQDNTGRLVAAVRQAALKVAAEHGFNLLLTDGPPGIGCPVISSLAGANLALLVTEPTLSGRHGLERVLGVCRHFGVPALVCINKFDLNEENSCHIEERCYAAGIPVAARIPFDNAVTEALVRGVPVVEYSNGSACRHMAALWGRVRQALG